MCRASTVAAAIVCLLPLLLAAAAAATVATSYCELLANKTATRVKKFGRRSVVYGDGAVNVSLVWGSEPAHAAAALLAAQLRHVRLYDGVLLPRAPSPHDISELAATVTYNTNAIYTNLVVSLSTAWQPGPPSPWDTFRGQETGLAGPRLIEFGTSPVAARRRLYAWLTETARNLDCLQLHVRWPFYLNSTALAACDFVDAANLQDNEFVVYVLGDDECKEVVRRLQRRAEHSGARLRMQRRGRAGFERSLLQQHSANRSFLFLDYDIWQGVPGVSVVEPPPCESVNFDCKQELDPAIAMRVADVNILRSYAPQFFEFIYDFKPPPESLRLILERQANGVDIEEVACLSVLEAGTYNHINRYDLNVYTVISFLCYNDPSNQFYYKIGQNVGKFIYEQTFKFGYEIKIVIYFVNCSDDHHMSEKLINLIGKRASFNRLIGVVSITAEGATAASALAAASHVPFVLADVAPEDDWASSTWRVGPRPRHLALALLHFARESGWTCVAVLSQRTKLAQDYYATLKEGPEIVLRDFPIPLHNITDQQAQKILQDLQDVNARIVFVNADARAASTILAAAVVAHMGYKDGFVWIVRDWQQNDVGCGTEHFTVSSWTRGMEDLPSGEGDDTLHDKLKNLPRLWPPRAVSFADALLTLSNGFLDIFVRSPSMRHNLHSDQMIRSLKESLISKPVTSVSQQLRFKERSIEEVFVSVDQWCGGNFTQRLATWRVNATSGTVHSKSGKYAALSLLPDLPLHDDPSSCVVRSGDAFRSYLYPHLSLQPTSSPTSPRLEPESAVLLELRALAAKLAPLEGLKDEIVALRSEFADLKTSLNQHFSSTSY